MARRIVRSTPKVSKPPAKKTRWKHDPKIKGAVLIPVDEALEAVGIRVSPRVLPNTVVRRRPGDDELGLSLVTTMPDGARVAWDICGRCHYHVTICTCREGVYHTASIAWMLSKTEEWMGGPEHVPGRYFEPTIFSARTAASKEPRPYHKPLPIKAPVAFDDDDMPPRARKGRSAPQRAAQGVADTSDIDNLDLAKLGIDASAQAERYTSMFDDLLNNDNTNKKRVIKRGKKSTT